MATDDGTYQPWSELQSLLAIARAGSSRRQHHPRRSILRAYSQESLPERPGVWTRERVETLAAGTLEEWTRWEVAAHVANCSRCRRAIDGLGRSTTLSLQPGIASLKHLLRQPRWAAAGWIFAGVQAAALVGLVLWVVFSSPTAPKKDEELIYPTLIQVSQMSGTLRSPSVWVEFEPDAPWQGVTAWLQALGLEVWGPDAEGRYLLLGEEIEPEELLQNRWVLRVESVKGGDWE